MNDREQRGGRPQGRQPLSHQGNDGRRGDGRDKENVIRVSTNRNTRFWIYLSKVYLKRHKEVELQGFGDAISSCVRVSENLERFGYAKFTKLNTITTTVVSR